MNEKIKANRFRLRAWVVEEFVMIYVWGIEENKHAETVINMELMHPRDAILMQSTGLCDKNGQEIFEGDVIRQGRHPISEVFFRTGSFCTYIDVGGYLEMSQSSFCDKFEVIGNIHENPELLNPKETT